MGPDKGALDASVDGADRAEIESAVRKAAGEYLGPAAATSESELKARLAEERRRREKLEARLTELAEENRRGRQQAEQADRHSQIRNQLQELGVRKIQLAFRLLKDDIFRGEDGELYAEVDGVRLPYKPFLTKFVSDNPEFLPPRISGGSGVSAADSGELSSSGIDMERIRPGMSQEELARAWKEVARLAGQGSS